MGLLIAPDRFASVAEIADELKHAAIYEFSSLSGPTALPQAAGVYVIFDKRNNDIYYVGKTTNLRQRLYHNHLMGPISNARLKKYLMDDPAFPDISGSAAAKDYIKKHCAFAFLLEPDMRARGHLEGLLSFLTDCRYVDREH